MEENWKTLRADDAVPDVGVAIGIERADGLPRAITLGHGNGRVKITTMNFGGLVLMVPEQRFIVVGLLEGGLADRPLTIESGIIAGRDAADRQANELLARAGVVSVTVEDYCGA